LLNYENNYVEYSSVMSNVAKRYDILIINLSVLHNYFKNLTKLFSDLHLAKFLDKQNRSFCKKNNYVYSAVIMQIE